MNMTTGPLGYIPVSTQHNTTANSFDLVGNAMAPAKLSQLQKHRTSFN